MKLMKIIHIRRTQNFKKMCSILESIRARRATSFVCSTCPFVCKYGGACLHGTCVCTPQLGPAKPGHFPTPVVRP